MGKSIKNYSITKFRVWALIATLLFGVFLYLQLIYYLIPGGIKFFSKEVNLLTLYDIHYMWIPIISYVLTSIEIILITMMISGKKLKYPKGNPFELFGLIDGLVSGLVVGLLVGLLAGLIGGFVIGLVLGLVLCLVFRLIFGLIGGLIGGLVLGLLSGLFGGLILGLLGGLIGGLKGGLVSESELEPVTIK
ncbi:MAG: hypothetical protein ACI870_000601 [Crocinitomicaceae bacterium]|jgi:hypothetical protein